MTRGATLAAATAAVLLAAAGPAAVHVGDPNPAAQLYGPADMLCDLNKCRLFNLPDTAGLPPQGIVEFGIPAVQDGQDRVAMRRCSEQMCRASVLGTPSQPTSPSGTTNPSLFITPIELRIE